MFRRRFKFKFRRQRRYRRRPTFGKRVRRVIMRTAETKFCNYSGVISPVQEGPDQYSLGISSIIETGTNKDKRIGNKIFMRGIHMKMALDSNGIDDVYIRVLLLKAKGVPTTVTNTDLPQTINDFVDREKWETYWDKTINLGLSSDNGRDKTFINKFVKVNRNVLYDNPTGSSNLPFLFVALSNDAVLPSPTINFSCRIFFKDI